MFRSPNTVRVIKYRSTEEGRNALKILTGKPTGKRPLGRFRLRREDNIRMDFKEIGVNTRNWVDSV